MALTKYNFNSFDVTPVASRGLAFDADADGFTTATPGAMTLIKTQTASDVASIEFKNGTSDVVLDGTYNSYLFKFIGMHPENNATDMTVNFSVDTGSNYNVSKNTTFFRTQHYENGTSGVVAYVTGNDLANGTGEQYLQQDGSLGNENDECLAGYMYLFNPSSTTFVKHFMATTIENTQNERCRECFVAGYGNTTSAIDAVRFKCSSGNINGTIKLYGLAK